MALTIAAAGALAGPPISGAIYCGTGGYQVVGYYAGKCPQHFLSLNSDNAFLREHDSSFCDAHAAYASPCATTVTRQVLVMVE